MSEFKDKNGPIPGKNFDNEVKVKKNPNDVYSPEFVEANKKKLADLKAKRNQ